MPGKDPLVKPYLKWAGGKRRLLPEILKYIPKGFDTYFEPFVGAGAVLLSQQPQNAIINDFNEQLVLTYRVIQSDVQALITALEEHERNNSREYYYQIRIQDRSPSFAAQDDVRKAARLIYLNKTCFNGLYRVNSQGFFNVPYGRYKRPVICEREALCAVSRYLNTAHVEIRCGDFADVLEAADEHSFVYLDPPYHSPGNANFTGYQAGGFDEQEQIRLKDTIDKLTQRGVRCLLSNSDTPFIRALYRGRPYKTKIVRVARNINSDADGRGKVQEVLVRNF